MQKVRNKRIGDPSVLHRIKPETLARLLGQFEAFFTERGVHLSENSLSPDQIDTLSDIIVAPPSTCPGPFLDAIEILEMLNTSEALDELRIVAGDLFEKVQETGDTAGDIALKIWLIDRTTVDRIYTKFSVDKARTMKCFTPIQANRHTDPDLDICRRMASELRFIFQDLFDTPACEVMAFEEEEGYAVLIRHGDRIKRLEILDDMNRRDITVLRPLKHDVAFVYHTGEVLISGRSRDVIESYRRVFSKHLYGDYLALKPSKRFTLDPLRSGRDCLGNEKSDLSPRLRELHMRRIGTGRTLTIRCDDVFDELEEHGSDYLRDFDLLRAKFTLHQSNTARSHTVIITPANDSIRGDIHHPDAKLWIDHSKFNACSRDANNTARN